jgi:HEAT repeat protein
VGHRYQSRFFASRSAKLKVATEGYDIHMRFSPFYYLLLLFPAMPAQAQPDVSAWEVLKIGLNDPKNFDRRRQAVTAIGSIGLAPEAIKQVEHGLRDDDSLVRQTAAAELGQMKSRSSIPALKAALEDPAGEVAFTAARALWDMGDQSGETVLQEVLLRQQKSTGGFIEGRIRDAKRKMHDPKALALMGINEASGILLGPFSMGLIQAEDFLKDSGAPGRVLAAALLAQHCDTQNLDLLHKTLKEDKNPSVRAAAAKEMGHCGNPDDIPLVEQYLSDSHDVLRLMSAATVVRLSLIQQGQTPPLPQPGSEVH